MFRNSCKILKPHYSCISITRPRYRFVGPFWYSSAAVGGGGGGGGGGVGVGGGGGEKRNESNEISHAEAKRLMRLVDVDDLKRKLGVDNREVIEYSELLDACRKMGLAKTSAEATTFSGILDEAGVILLFRNKVYLHPDKVVDTVRKAIPVSLLPEDDITQTEMKQLHDRLEEIDMQAHKQVRRILWAGLGLSVIQVGLFFRLTFWEFSWDVMEPIAFFTTAIGIVMGYGYFLFTSRDPTYHDFMKRLFLSRQRKLIKRHNFDIQRFVELHKRCKPPHGLSPCVRKQMGIDVEPEDLLHGH